MISFSLLIFNASCRYSQTRNGIIRLADNYQSRRRRIKDEYLMFHPLNKTSCLAGPSKKANRHIFILGSTHPLTRLVSHQLNQCLFPSSIFRTEQTISTFNIPLYSPSFTQSDIFMKLIIDEAIKRFPM